MTTSLLDVGELSGGYGEVTVIRQFTASVCAGEVVFITGRNGVGKSTLAKLIAGHLPPSSGWVKLLNKDLTSISGHQRRSNGLGYAPQENVVFSDLTVLENLVLQYSDRSLDRYPALFEQFPFITQRLEQKAGTLSGGEKKVLSFCRALGEDTRIVLLDEPTEGVQPENIERMRHFISEQTEAGRGFLIVEQNLHFMENTADRVHLLDHGECVYKTFKQSGLRNELASRLKI